MSYILDALKKSQRQRELGSVPRLTTEQLASHRRGFSIVPWAVAGAAVATAAVLVALYGPFGHSIPEADKKAVPEPETSSLAPSADILQPASQGDAPVAARGGQQSAAPVPLSAAIAAGPVGGSDVIRTNAVAAPEAVRHVNAPAPSDVGAPAVSDGPEARTEVTAQDRSQAGETQSATVSTATASVGDGPMQSAPLLSELSFDVQSSLPALALNVHVYAQTPKDRFVFLNMQKYKEGERTRDGVLIEEITPEGVVLRYGQQRFRLVY